MCVAGFRARKSWPEHPMRRRISSPEGQEVRGLVLASEQAEVLAGLRRAKAFHPWAAIPKSASGGYPGVSVCRRRRKFSLVGRGGKSSRDDPGILPPRHVARCAESAGPTHRFFTVCGHHSLIILIVVRAPYLTIAGQTAPGDGVCIAGTPADSKRTTSFVRYMRFRRGAMDVGDRTTAVRKSGRQRHRSRACACSFGFFDRTFPIYRHILAIPNTHEGTETADMQHHDQWSMSSKHSTRSKSRIWRNVGLADYTFHHDFRLQHGENCSMGVGANHYIRQRVFTGVITRLMAG